MATRVDSARSGFPRRSGLVEVEHQCRWVVHGLDQRDSVPCAGERHAWVVDGGVQVLEDEGDVVLLFAESCDSFQGPDGGDSRRPVTVSTGATGSPRESSPVPCRLSRGMPSRLATSTGVPALAGERGRSLDRIRLTGRRCDALAHREIKTLFALDPPGPVLAAEPASNDRQLWRGSAAR